MLRSTFSASLIRKSCRLSNESLPFISLEWIKRFPTLPTLAGREFERSMIMTTIKVEEERLRLRYCCKYLRFFE